MKQVSVIVTETGLTEATLHQWRKQVRVKGIAAPGGEQEVERWSIQEKLPSRSKFTWYGLHHY